MKDLIGNLRKVPVIFYILNILICVVFILLSASYFADDPKHDLSMLMYMIKGDRSLSALDMWYNALSSDVMNSWLLILTPLLCSMSYIYSFCIDISSGCFLFSLNRQGLRRFTLSRFLCSGIYSSIVMLSSLLISFVIAFMYSRNLGDRSYAPVCEMLIHRQSVSIAFTEVCITYMCYAFFIGVLCITLASFMNNAFTSCSFLVLILFMAGEVKSSYHSNFFTEMLNGKITYADYNHYTDFLFVGNLSHGMPDFEEFFPVSYEIYISISIMLIILIYILFHTVVKKKVMI